MTTYADSSALVKLFIAEEGSAEIQALVRSEDIIGTAAIAYPELRAALASAIRGRRIPAASRDHLVGSVERVWETLLKISVDEPVLRQAGDLAERLHLRAYDAVHLAALQEMGEPGAVTFACWDADLRGAARQLGYQLVPA